MTVFAPGSVSNVGPGFDCFGIAVAGRGDRVTAWRSAEPGVRVVAVSDPRIPLAPGRNTAAIAAHHMLSRSGAGTGLELSIEKGLPLSGGLGGSAASAVAGAVAAHMLLELNWPQRELLLAALEAEAVVSGRHPDNVAPSLFGGAVLICDPDQPVFTRVKVHPSLRLVLVTPAYTVETAAARAVLPPSVSRATAIAQAARLGTLVLGLERADAALIDAAMRDAIAEPARASLFPGYAQARAAGLQAGACGVAVSGAGPTVVAVAREPDAEVTAAAMREAYARQGIGAIAQVAQVDEQGARAVVA
ncbi:MAG TPA: homoserine kinase [Vicinamibacteria bacterium]